MHGAPKRRDKYLIYIDPILIGTVPLGPLVTGEGGSGLHRLIYTNRKQIYLPSPWTLAAAGHVESGGEPPLAACWIVDQVPRESRTLLLKVPTPR